MVALIIQRYSLVSRTRWVMLREPRLSDLFSILCNLHGIRVPLRALMTATFFGQP